MSAISFSPADRLAAIGHAREDLYDFTRWMFLQRKGFRWIRGRHHQIVADALMRVYRGECTRLIINIPPRYGKTELVNNFVAWCLGKAPDSEFILTSYSAQLAANNSWQGREILLNPAYREIFQDVSLRDDKAARHEWCTTAGGIVYAAGSGGTITGYGAGKHREGFGGAIIIDDPHKADEARSDVMRSGVIEFFQNTLESRQNYPGKTPIILIMQRLHEKDLAGWLIDGGNGEKWEVISLPALQDDGTALWPEKHTADMLRVMKEAKPYTFSGQYQQKPSPPEGGFFKPDKIVTVDAVPAGVEWVRGWDFAATEEKIGKDPDWTVGGKLGKLPDGRFIIGDIVRLRTGPDERDEALVNTTKRDGSAARVSIPQDPGQAGKTQALYLTRALAGFSVTATPESGDKVTRAEPFAAQVNVGNVLMVRADWNDALISELRMFPNGAHDDQVDALSRAFAQHVGSNFGMLDFLKQQAEAKEAQQTQATQTDFSNWPR